MQANDAALSAGGRAAGGVDPDFERSVRRWLKAYPPRWRAARADEVLGTLVELAAPGATRLDRRAAFGLLVGGLRTRVRTGPPLHQRIGYMFGLRTSPKHLDWMADDLAAPMTTASLLRNVVGMGLISVPCWTQHEEGWAWAILGIGLVAAISDAVAEDNLRGKRRLRLLLRRPGDPTRWPYWVEGSAPRVRAAARDVSSATAACLAWGTVIGIVAWAGTRSPRHEVSIGAIALSLGIVGAAVATWRWKRWAGRGPKQPNRVVLRWRARSMTFAVCCGLLPWRFVTDDVFGAFTAPAVAIAGLVALPATLAAWLWSLALPADVAAHDLTWVAITGKPPNPDVPVLAAVPAGSPGAARAAGLIDLLGVDDDRPALG